jgi:hypothetical protein
LNCGSIHYICICSEGGLLNNPVIIGNQLVIDNACSKVLCDYTKSRKKLFKQLTPAPITFMFFGTNTVSVSPLGDPLIIMAAQRIVVAFTFKLYFLKASFVAQLRFFIEIQNCSSKNKKKQHK